MKTQGILKGVAIGIFCSLIIPFLFVNIAQSLAGGHTNFFGEIWLYIAISIPMILSMAIIGYFLSTKKSITNKKMWWISFWGALIVSLFTNTLGVLISNMLLSDNFKILYDEESLKFGIIYSFIFLPITVPLGKFILNYLYKWINQKKSIV